MNESPFEEWVEKAEEDFRAARALDPSDVPDIVCFLSQQCIEKYLKAALARQRASIPRIHDLVVLNDTVAEGDKRFEKLYEQLVVLNPFSVAVRYPGTETTAKDAKQAVEAMRKLRKKIRSLLNLEVKE
jgi:HEPN domain-containing protein